MARDKSSNGRRGISLAMRLALLIAGMVALFMVAFAFVLRGFIREWVQEQVRLAAWEAASTAAHADLVTWDEWLNTPYQGKSVAEMKVIIESMTPYDYDQTFNAPALLKILGWNRERFSRFLEQGSRIVAVELLSADDPPRTLAASYNTALMTFTPYSDQPELPLPAGSANEGTLSLGAEQRHVVRGSHPVVDSEGVRMAEFAVYIEANAIEQATAHLMRRVISLAAVFVVIGAGIAYLAGRRILRPVSLLQEDMAIVADGDLEHRTQAHTNDEIGSLARSFDKMTQGLLAARRAEREAAASRQQMSVAGEITTSLFPTSLPEIPGWDVAGHHEAAAGQLSGDYYDVLPLPGGRWAFLVGAASGSGVPAAMVMAMARSFLAAVARTEADPGAILREVNALLSGDLRRGMYVTVLLAVLDPEAGTLTIANAGHAPLLFARGGTGKLSPVLSEGIALGFDKGPVFDRTLKVVRLRVGEGDRAVLFTPGVTRVTGADGTTLDEERFVALVKREAGNPAALFVRRVAAVVRKFRGERPLSDDVTLLTLGRLPPGGGSGASAGSGPGNGNGESAA